MADFTELQEALDMALLGEDWEKTQKAKAAKHPDGPSQYHSKQGEVHREKEKIFNTLAAAAKYPSIAKKHNLDPEKAEYYKQKAVRHRRLGTAHSSLAIGGKAMPNGKSEPFTSSGGRNTWVPLPAGVKTHADYVKSKQKKG